MIDHVVYKRSSGQGPEFEPLANKYVLEYKVHEPWTAIFSV